MVSVENQRGLAAQVYFGLWLVPMGYLAYKSAGMFPRWLGTLVVIGGVCYLVDLLALFLLPDLGKQIHTYVGIIPTALAEVSLLVYLLVVGVRLPKRDADDRIPAAA